MRHAVTLDCTRHEGVPVRLGSGSEGNRSLPIVKDLLVIQGTNTNIYNVLAQYNGHIVRLVQDITTTVSLF